ncbi:MAG TPA: hypothetical protein VGC44_08160, partial [Longimicrobiales bacterium]
MNGGGYRGRGASVPLCSLCVSLCEMTRLFALLLASASLVACNRAPATNDGGRANVRIVAVTHGQSADPFWSVVSNGINDAARDLGVRVEYQAPTSFDMVRMSQLI